MTSPKPGHHEGKYDGGNVDAKDIPEGVSPYTSHANSIQRLRYDESDKPNRVITY